MYLDDVVKSPTEILAVLAIYGPAFQPIDTVPNDSSNFIAASPDTGANQ